MNYQELPIGFAMALAETPGATECFAQLSDEKKQQIIDGTHAVKSGEEMQMYVYRLLGSK